MPGPIYSITPFTLLDYPGKAACIIWFAGCNMRCRYCYNPEIVLGKGREDVTEALAFLRSRRGLLEGVVLSGGECTLHRSIFPLLASIKELGFFAKVDTNGSRPVVMQALVKQGLIDYVALDFKAPEYRYSTVTQSNLFPAFIESLLLLMDAGIPFEVRTTVHCDLMGMEELQAMVASLQNVGYRGNYYIQHFVNNVPVLDRTLGRSSQLVNPERLSTKDIRVVLRRS